MAAKDFCYRKIKVSNFLPNYEFDWLLALPNADLVFETWIWWSFIQSENTVYNPITSVFGAALLSCRTENVDKENMSCLNFEISRNNLLFDK